MEVKVDVSKIRTGHNFKRIYAKDENGAVIQPLKVDHLVVLRAKKRWHVSPKLLATGQAEGWLSMSGNTLTITHRDGKIDYKVLAQPGYYCCHCGAALHAGAGKAHVEANHAGQKSPDPQNPSGYKVNHYFDCEKVN